MAKTERRRAPKRSKREEVPTEPQLQSVEPKDPEWVRADSNTPFGLVPTPMQAYFKEANAQLTQLVHSEDANEDVDMLLSAALSEMDGSELALATDPTCSLVLENMAPMLKSKALRVLVDRMAGNYVVLATHRYGSHVLQAILASIQVAVAGGDSGVAAASEDGVLRTLPELVIALYEELELSMLELITDAFASHVVRTMIALLAGVPIASVDDLRSKRSAKYRSKERQRAMVDDSMHAAGNGHVHVPEDFLQLLLRMYHHISTRLSTDQVHALMPSATAAPTLSLLLRLEASLPYGKHSMAWRKDSLTARVLGDPSSGDAERSDLMEAALRDAVATHVLEAALGGASDATLLRFWQIYLCGRIAKLGAHPCANFVVAALLRLLPASRGEEAAPYAHALQELTQAGDQLVKNQMLGVLQAAVERSAAHKDSGNETMHAIQSAFRFPSDASADVRKLFVPVVLSMRTLKAYTHVQSEDRPAKRKRGSNEDYTIQGSVLLQKVTLLPAESQTWLFESLTSDALATWCRSPTAVHVVIAALTTSTASYSQRRSLIKALMPMMVELCNDTWGSRVADAVWAAADGFTKEKIAQMVIDHEKQLLASTYGRFFVRRLRLGMYRKNLADWKAWAVQDTPAVPTPNAYSNPFAFLRTEKTLTSKHTKSSKADHELESIFKAIE